MRSFYAFPISSDTSIRYITKNMNNSCCNGKISIKVGSVPKRRLGSQDRRAEKKAPSPPKAHDFNEDRRCAGPWSFPLSYETPRNKPDPFSVQQFRDSWWSP
ncbi:hypothetical protein TNCT_246071 [Trichonephila clavata]|uniref:Uncharacterized protein n=1 Tax=Trichonephila clavata TaxID=2740835 RepID=A0A8X6L3Q0_TRICU|nr:hypothetical protein TNCT_246071 [Trichonephila clavata]